MNKLVAMSTVAAAAVPFAAGATPSVVTSFNDDGATAALKRAEEAVELMRSRYIREGWKIDEVAAERALAYCRRRAEVGGDDPSESDEREAIDFFHTHGMSLDWIFFGDIAGLICAAASHSPRALAIAAAPDPIFAVIEAHQLVMAKADHVVRETDVIALQRRGIVVSESKKKKFEARQNRFFDEEYGPALNDLVSTCPSTSSGIAALLGYIREHGGAIKYIGADDRLNILHSSLERSARGLAGLDVPLKNDQA